MTFDNAPGDATTHEPRGTRFVGGFVPGVLVVAGRGDDQVGGEHAGVFEDGGFAGVAGDEVRGDVAFEFGDAVVVEVDEGDLVAGGGEDVGYWVPSRPAPAMRAFMCRAPCPEIRAAGRGRWPPRRR